MWTNWYIAVEKLITAQCENKKLITSRFYFFVTFLFVVEPPPRVSSRGIASFDNYDDISKAVVLHVQNDIGIS